VIGRYVSLDRQGLWGCCPLPGNINDDGKDSHPSFRVRALRPGSLQLLVLLCLARRGRIASLTFCGLWSGLSPREVWRRVLARAKSF